MAQRHGGGVEIELGRRLMAEGEVPAQVDRVVSKPPTLPLHLAARQIHRNFRRPSAARLIARLAPVAQLDTATAF
jgi:hypothetical protein